MHHFSNRYYQRVHLPYIQHESATPTAKPHLLLTMKTADQCNWSFPVSTPPPTPRILVSSMLLLPDYPGMAIYSSTDCNGRLVSGQAGEVSARASDQMRTRHSMRDYLLDGSQTGIERILTVGSTEVQSNNADTNGGQH